MERLCAALYSSVLLAMSVAVHLALSMASPQPLVPTIAASGEVVLAVASSEGTEPRIQLLGYSLEREPSPAPPPLGEAPLDLSPLGMVESTRGLWLTDSSLGRVARLDRGPVPRQTGLVPIVMYHHVQPIDFSRSSAFASSLTLPPAMFEQQLRYLKERGIGTVTMNDLALYLQGRKDLPLRSVVLTFDDGYHDNYLYAYPLLRRYGSLGTFYIITDLLGQGDYMAWWQLREMAAGGMEIGSHTLSHPDLARISAAQRERELTESKRVLEAALGAAVTALSYPSGAYSPDVVAAARKAGYLSAVTTRYGATHDSRKPLELPRVRVHGMDTLATFQWRIEQYFPSVETAVR